MTGGAHCDIVMVTWNATEMTRNALESIRQTANFPYRLIIVDNSDDRDTIRFLEQSRDSGQFGEILLIRNDANIGWLKATNIGLKQATGAYVCLLNNDVIAGKNWLKNCVDLMQANPDIGLVNPRGNERSENAKVIVIDQHAQSLEKTYPGVFTELDHCSGFCMLIRRSVLDAVGLLDETYGDGYYEDVDYSRRVQAAGSICAQCDSAYVYHLGSQSFGKVPEKKKRLNEKNRQIFEARWGKQQRLLLLPKCDLDEGFVAAARQSRIYLIKNRHVSPALARIRHENLIFIALPKFFIFENAYFFLHALYLSHKKRIDEAVIKFH